MMGYKNWLTASPHNPETNGLRYLGHYPRDKQKEFMTSPEWTRAIFVRDPLERTLSSYTDKALNPGHPDWQPRVEGARLKHLCCRMNNNSETTTTTKRRKRINPACEGSPMSPYKNPITKINFPF
jgi:hypothetical protein